MSEVTLQSLYTAIGALAFEREALLQRIAAVPPEVESEEELSEQVMLIEQVLGEYRDLYRSQRGSSTTYPAYEETVAGAKARAIAHFQRSA